MNLCPSPVNMTLGTLLVTVMNQPGSKLRPGVGNRSVHSDLITGPLEIKKKVTVPGLFPHNVYLFEVWFSILEITLK